MSAAHSSAVMPLYNNTPHTTTVQYIVSKYNHIQKTQWGDWMYLVSEVGVGRGSEEQWQKFENAGLDELLQEGESRSAFVLRYTLTHPGVHTIIVGTTRREHLEENIEAVLSGPLPDSVYAEAKTRLDSVGERAAPAT